jgi:hypothetical protein
MRFQANPDNVISLVTRLTYHTNFTARRAIIIGKNEKNKRLGDKKSPVDFGLSRNELGKAEKISEITYIFLIFI